MSRKNWFDNPLTPMKIGTIPALVLVHGTDRERMTPGNWVRVKECEGGKWSRVLIDNINANGDIFASR